MRESGREPNPNLDMGRLVEALLEPVARHARQQALAAQQLVAGRLVVVYEHPDGDDPLVARVVTVWRRR